MLLPQELLFIVFEPSNPWPHEKQVAKILALAEHYVEFIPETSIKTPDIYLERTIFEIKSPISDKIDAIERNITRALEKAQTLFSIVLA
ncbi:hypothetical protein IJI00_01255 [Candidatus Saccharibacteria bacterium]|nr:hypothetical protein [Candidatus Saccharibacteria bacterium]